MGATQLKKPTGVLVLAILFILAPIGNILISIAGSGIPDWYDPSVMWRLLASIPYHDWSWLVMLFLTGILLLRAHKTFWVLALTVLAVVLGINIYRAMNGDLMGSAYVRWQTVISIFSTLAVFVMAFYFRFPYLDRRSSWFLTTASRYDLRTEVQVVAQDIYDGVTESISTSGARVRVRLDMGEKILDLQFVDLIFPGIRNIKINAQVVEYVDNVARLKFRNLAGKEKVFLRDWIKSQTEKETTNQD